MKKNKNKKISKFVHSIEDASIMRKFSILFLMVSILPLLTLFSLYTEFRSFNRITITEDQFSLVLIFIVLGILAGYSALRKVMLQVIQLSNANRKVLESVLSKDKLRELEGEENEIAVLTRTFTLITDRLEDNINKLKLAKRTLQSVMVKVGRGISSMENIDSFLDLIIETVTGALGGSTGTLILKGEGKNHYYLKIIEGASDIEPQDVRIKTDAQSIMGKVIRSKESMIIWEPESTVTEAAEHNHLFEAPLICTPLVMQDQVNGVICVSGIESSEKLGDDEKHLLYNLATQTAIAIDNFRLSDDIDKTYFETISALALAVDAKDKYSRGHLDRVADYSFRIAKKLGLEESEMRTLRDGARLHDLGKIGIPDEVLSKTGPLTYEERELMKKHTEIGESIIKPIRSLNHLCDLIRHHHEKLDGSGYPDGLASNQISPLVRILTIADIYDALTTDRPYRVKFGVKVAIEALRNMNDQLDQDIVEVFVEVITENPSPSMKLS